jgi:hypothetical protein
MGRNSFDLAACELTVSLAPVPQGVGLGTELLRGGGLHRFTMFSVIDFCLIMRKPTAPGLTRPTFFCDGSCSGLLRLVRDVEPPTPSAMKGSSA